MHSEHQVLTGRKIKTAKGVFEITSIFFSCGFPVSVWLNDKFRFTFEEFLEKEFEWL